MWNSFIQWLEGHQGTCLFHKYLGIQCPGCGFQRSLLELLKGNFLESVKLYPATIPILFMLLFLILHLKFNFKHGALALKICFIFTSVIIVTNYIFKVLTNNIY